MTPWINHKTEKSSATDGTWPLLVSSTMWLAWPMERWCVNAKARFKESCMLKWLSWVFTIVLRSCLVWSWEEAEKHVELQWFSQAQHVQPNSRTIHMCKQEYLGSVQLYRCVGNECLLLYDTEHVWLLACSTSKVKWSQSCNFKLLRITMSYIHRAFWGHPHTLHSLCYWTFVIEL